MIIYVYMYICIYVSMYICIYIYIHVCVCICVGVGVCVCWLMLFYIMLSNNLANVLRAAEARLVRP